MGYPQSRLCSCCGWHRPHTHTPTICSLLFLHVLEIVPTPHPQSNMRPRMQLCKYIHASVLCTLPSNYCTWPIKQSEMMHKFLSVVTVCPMKVRVVYLQFDRFLLSLSTSVNSPFLRLCLPYFSLQGCFCITLCRFHLSILLFLEFLISALRLVAVIWKPMIDNFVYLLKKNA